jgi:hypothetical protein
LRQGGAAPTLISELETAPASTFLSVSSIEAALRLEQNSSHDQMANDAGLRHGVETA